MVEDHSAQDSVIVGQVEKYPPQEVIASQYGAHFGHEDVDIATKSRRAAEGLSRQVCQNSEEDSGFGEMQERLEEEQEIERKRVENQYLNTFVRGLANEGFR